MAKAELAYILAALVIPYNDFIGVESCVIASANQRKDVASEEGDLILACKTKYNHDLSIHDRKHM
jgi:hypothetical protein